MSQENLLESLVGHCCASPHSIRSAAVFSLGYLSATAAQDWPLLLEVSERASATAAAREAVRSLRREFKFVHPHLSFSSSVLIYTRYGEPAQQLSAAKVDYSVTFLRSRIY